MRQGRRNAARDTTVIVEGIRDTDVVLDDYLFLRQPPKDTVFSTDLGSLLTDDKYRAKVYVKGIFVEKRTINDPPPLYYGVNFNHTSLDRDRRSVMSGHSVASSLAKMWDIVISKDQPGTAEKYLDLLLAHDDNFMEVLHANRSISRESAVVLLRGLQNRFPEKFFHCAEDPNAVEVLTTKLV
jgi:hypothetical protein